MPEATPEEIAVAYHERTKHHFHRFAASLGYLDWDSQPDPFRRYAGARLVPLPMPAAGRALPYWRLYVPGAVPSEPLALESLSLFFRCSLALTAWKQYGESKWSLRANPSSGNLHPTEGYAVLPAVDGFADEPGVFHYAPKEHVLECRAVLRASWSDALLPQGAFLVALTSIFWREAWKYGERAFRYCQHDVGHALAALRISAAALGWQLVLLDGVSAATLARLLGVDRAADFGSAERESAELLAVVLPGGSPPGVLPSEESLLRLRAATWQGCANRLSPEHPVDWDVIDEVARATRPERRAPIVEDFARFPTEAELFGVPVRSGRLSAERAILGRRSAVAMDGRTSIPRATFFRLLARCVPTRDRRSVPFDALPWRPRIHLGLFVHKVEGLASGLYALPRDPDKIESMRAALDPRFLWQRVSSCPPGLPLYLLREDDCRALAARVSCGQDIAGDGAFSLGMLAEATDSLLAYGAAFYRNLFWEAGMVGQMLYLEAEEAGIRSTGIGCYFDDAVHAAFGIASREWQSFYHFAAGGPVEDARLTTLPAYDR
jgi:SagB-type dehydrogenase family enzyme